MSITITIRDNREYVTVNCPDRIDVETYDCQCDFDGNPNKNCCDCGGTGVVQFRNYPWEMNLANGSFTTLWSALGMDADWCGEIDARVLLHRLRTTDPSLAERADEIQRQEGSATFISFGIDGDRTARYFAMLETICREAERREQPILWY